MRERLFAPVPTDSLVAFRVLFGALMLFEICSKFADGSIARNYSGPTFHFTYPGFAWVVPPPEPGMTLLFVALGILALLVMAGVAARASAALFFLGFTYVFLIDQALYLNHFYFISLMAFVLALLPLAGSGAMPAWCLWLLRFQVGVPYFFGGVAKLNGDWLFRAWPLKKWLAEYADAPLAGSLLAWEPTAHFMSIAGLFFDLGVVPLLLWRRTRGPMFLAALAFHLMNAALFRIGIFPWFMIAATTVFFEPDWPSRALSRVGARFKRSSVRALAPTSPRARAGLLAALGAWALFHCLFPLRHLLYPGDVSWTDEGRRFSWHMMSRTKSGDARMFARDPQTGEEWEVDLKRHLTYRQYQKMTGRPEMLRQFARFLSERLSVDGRVPVEIRADARVSLNGRPAVAIVDPSENLAR